LPPVGSPAKARNAFLVSEFKYVYAHDLSFPQGLWLIFDFVRSPFRLSGAEMRAAVLACADQTDFAINLIW
jgi:hypothetical protein